MAERLQKEGPPFLNTLNSSALLHLTDRLISEKRWVEERLSQALPFKLIHPAKKFLSPNPRCPNGLSAIFSGKSSEGNLRRLPNHEKEKEDPNHSKTGVNLYKSNGKPPGKSESQMLTDSQKLVAELLVEHPEGFNMGTFKDLFLEKYGYSLKCQMLGFQKLSSLLQTMPGVKIEYSYVIPSGKSPRDFSMECAVPNNSTGKLSDSAANGLSDSVGNDDHDSAWEELGPISETNSNVNVTESNLNRKTNLHTSGSGDFKDYGLSDDEFSDFDTGYPTKDWQERQRKPRRKEEDCTLLGILDSWYTSKEGKSYQDRQKHEDEFVDCSRNDSKHKDLSSSDFNSISLTTISGQNTKHRKNYSFVHEKGVDDKDQLIDGILGSLKKSAVSRLQN
ncbi:OST-HTH/LOTUS domain [Macleaya cordata]|uniref:OST-HTH/LOTUS domain n=1 Tax=Macleaya cordata TaxID=56857 RepID=A0A200PYL5_MACCD|nr:OST-HTH/LOTUS domain [Macleaya cordata]